MSLKPQGTVDPTSPDYLDALCAKRGGRKAAGATEVESRDYLVLPLVLKRNAKGNCTGYSVPAKAPIFGPGDLTQLRKDALRWLAKAGVIEADRAIQSAPLGDPEMVEMRPTITKVVVVKEETAQ